MRTPRAGGSPWRRAHAPSRRSHRHLAMRGSRRRPRRAPAPPPRWRGTVAHAPVEVEVVFGLEPGHVAGRLAGESRLDRDIEQQREVRSEAVGRPVVELRAASRRRVPRRIPGRRASSRRNGAQTTVSPTASAGAITSRTSCRRAALNNMASTGDPSAPSTPVRSSSSSRIRSPSHVPPRFARHVDPSCRALQGAPPDVPPGSSSHHRPVRRS
jgi:hypothetical protein